LKDHSKIEKEEKEKRLEEQKNSRPGSDNEFILSKYEYSIDKFGGFYKDLSKSIDPKAFCLNSGYDLGKDISQVENKARTGNYSKLKLDGRKYWKIKTQALAGFANVSGSWEAIGKKFKGWTEWRYSSLGRNIIWVDTASACMSEITKTIGKIMNKGGYADRCPTEKALSTLVAEIPEVKSEDSDPNDTTEPSKVKKTAQFSEDYVQSLILINRRQSSVEQGAIRRARQEGKYFHPVVNNVYSWYAGI